MDRYFSPVPVTDLPSRLCTAFQWIFFLRPEKVFLLRFYPDRPFSLSLFFYSPGRVSFPFLLCAPANVPLSVAIPCASGLFLSSPFCTVIFRLSLFCTRGFARSSSVGSSYYAAVLHCCLFLLFWISSTISLVRIYFFETYTAFGSMCIRMEIFFRIGGVIG